MKWFRDCVYRAMPPWYEPNDSGNHRKWHTYVIFITTMTSQRLPNRLVHKSGPWSKSTKSSNWIQQYHPQQSYSTQCIGLHLSICKDPLLNEFLIDFMCEYLSRPLKVRKRGCYNDRSGRLSVHYRYPPSPKLLMRNRVFNTFFLSPQLYYVSHF